MIFNLEERPSIANKFVAELRNVSIQKDMMRFRRNLERLGEVMAYEISKSLKYQEQDVETPLGIAKVKLPVQRVVLGTILRAGIPLHQGLLNFFDSSENAFISAYRMHHKDGSFEINLEYVSCPNLTGCVLILADSMLATGASLNMAIKTLLEFGEPAEIHLVTAIASTAGLNYVKRMHPRIHVWMGALDEELTARSYIVPGLGDAGDLAYGSKVQD